MKKIEHLVQQVKNDIYFYVFLCILFALLGFVLKEKGIIFFGLLLFYILFLLGKLKCYKNIKKIQTYCKNNHLLEIEDEILYWNEESYILTEKYMIIKEKKIEHFSYDEILKIAKKSKINWGRHTSWDEYLYIKTKENKIYTILVNASLLVNENFKDISDILLDKNKNICFCKKEDL